MTIASGYGQAVHHWSITGGAKPYTCTHGFGDGTLTNTDGDTIADALYTAFVASTAPAAAANMYVGWTYLGVSVEIKDGSTIGTGDHFASIAGTAVTGSPAVPLVDPFNPIVVSKKTAFGGRPYRGRMYPPPTLVHQLNVDHNGTIVSTLVASLQTLWGNYLDAIAGSTTTQMVLNHDISTGISPPTTVTSLIVRNVLGSQRRRKARAS